MFTRSKTEPVPEVGAEAPEFNLPSAQGGQLRLSMRTPRGPVVVAFYRPGDEEDVEYFKALAAMEDEINLAAGSVAAIGIAEPTQALNFARASGLKSYVLYDYARITSRQWGLLEKDRKQGDFARRAVFVVGPDRQIAHAWVGERPEPEEILAKVSEISGLPKPPEEPKEDNKDDEEEKGDEKPKKMSAEEREKIKAERRAAREAGKSVKTGTSGPAAPSEDGGDEGKLKKMSAEERQRIKAERRAAREAGKSLKKPGSAGSTEAESDGKEEETKKEG
jgi:peroxiredoxin